MATNLINTRTKVIVVGVVALTPIMIALAARTDVPQTVATTVSVGQGDKFNDSWNDAASTVIFKSASLHEAEPKAVQTVKVEPTSGVIPPIILSEEKTERKPKIRHARVDKRDICQRHGLRKKITRGGKSWRCR